MGHAEARAWWADVEHLRDELERAGEARRRADVSDLSERRALRDERSDLSERRALRDERRENADESRSVSAPAPAEPARRMAAPRPGEHRARRAPEHRVSPAASRASTAPAHRASSTAASPAGGAPASFGGSPASARRTVEIRGRTVPAPSARPEVELERHRRSRSAVERLGPRPDRLALWALLMGILLILVAVGTADASVLAR